MCIFSNTSESASSRADDRVSWGKITLYTHSYIEKSYQDIRPLRLSHWWRRIFFVESLQISYKTCRIGFSARNRSADSRLIFFHDRCLPTGLAATSASVNMVLTFFVCAPYGYRSPSHTCTNICRRQGGRIHEDRKWRRSYRVESTCKKYRCDTISAVTSGGITVTLSWEKVRLFDSDFIATATTGNVADFSSRSLLMLVPGSPVPPPKASESNPDDHKAKKFKKLRNLSLFPS